MLLPVLAFLTFGLLDFGRAYYFQVAVTNAAREGARVAILNIYTGPQTPTCASSPWSYCPVQTDPAIRQAVQNEVNGTGITIGASQITICPPHDTADPACPNTNSRVANYIGNITNYYVTVTTRYNYTLYTPLFQNLVGNPITMKVSVQMRTNY